MHIDPNVPQVKHTNTQVFGESLLSLAVAVFKPYSSLASRRFPACLRVQGFVLRAPRALQLEVNSAIARENFFPFKKVRFRPRPRRRQVPDFLLASP